MNSHRPGPRNRDDCTKAPLDRARLADVLRGSAASAPALLTEFQRATDADSQELLDACAAVDLARVEQLAHRIEGACRVIGAGPMGQSCCPVVQACRSGEPGALGSAVNVFLERKQALYAYLTQHHPAASPVQAAGEGTAVCAGLVFLVVEGHEFQRGIIVRLLRQLGALEVHGFADGASALAAARELRWPAILVLDLAMPELNGMEVMRVAALEGLALSVIVNSALAQDMLGWPLQTARSYGTTVLGAVSKPLTAAKLVPLLAQHRSVTRGRAGKAVPGRQATQGRTGVVARWAQEPVAGMPADATAHDAPAPKPKAKPGPSAP